MAPPRPLHCTGSQGPSGAAGQTPQKSNGPSTSMWPMVLPESPLLTFSFAMWALSFSKGLRSATPLVCSVRSQRPLHLHAGFYAAGHGGDEPLQHGAAAAIQPQNGIPDPHPERQGVQSQRSKASQGAYEISSVRRYTPGREARCSKPKIQSIPSCIADVLSMPVHSKAARMGPATRCRKQMPPL